MANKYITLVGISTVALIVAAVLPLMGGCNTDPNAGYSFAPRFKEDIQTVSVPIFLRGTYEYRRGLEGPLTEAVIKRIELDSPYKVVDRSRADSILEGTMVSVDQKVLSYDPDLKIPRDVEVTITVSYTWKDLRTGEIISTGKNISSCGVYISSGGEDFSSGIQQSINKLAVAIVNDMEMPW